MRCRICKKPFNHNLNKSYEDSEQVHYKCPHCGAVFVRSDLPRSDYDEEADAVFAIWQEEDISAAFRLTFNEVI